MFIFSIIPLHLSLDCDAVAANAANKVDTAEHRVMELEALYSSLVMRQYLGTEISGVDNTNLDEVKAELDKTRGQEVQLMNTTWEQSENNSQARLDYVKRMQVAVDTRLKDLQTLAQNVSNGTQSSSNVSGVDNLNIIAINNEIERTNLYKTELQTSEKFWTQILEKEVKSTELKQASTFWSELVAGRMQGQELDIAYDLWKQMMNSKLSAQTLQSAASTMKDLVTDLSQRAEKEVTTQITDAEKLKNGFNLVAQGFGSGTETPEMITALKELSQTTTDSEIKKQIESTTDGLNQYSQTKISFMAARAVVNKELIDASSSGASLIDANLLKLQKEDQDAIAQSKLEAEQKAQEAILVGLQTLELRNKVVQKEAEATQLRAEAVLKQTQAVEKQTIADEQQTDETRIQAQLAQMEADMAVQKADVARTEVQAAKREAEEAQQKAEIARTEAEVAQQKIKTIQKESAQKEAEMQELATQFKTFTESLNKLSQATTQDSIKANSLQSQSMLEELKVSITKSSLITSNFSLKDKLNEITLGMTQRLDSQTKTNDAIIAQRKKVNEEMTSLNTQLDQRYQKMVKEKDTTIASNLWNKVLDSQKQNPTLWNPILQSTESAQSLNVALGRWNATTHDTSQTSDIQTQAQSWSNLMQAIKNGGSSQSSSVLGKQMIDGLKVADKLISSSNSWCQLIDKTTPIIKVVNKPDSTAPTGDLENYSGIAQEKRVVASLNIIHRSVNKTRSISSIKSQIEEVRSLLEEFKYRRSTSKQGTKFYNANDPIQSKINELSSELSSLMSQASVGGTMVNVGDVISSFTSVESMGIDSNVQGTGIL